VLEINSVGSLRIIFYHDHNRIPVQALVLHLSSLKEGVGNEFPLPLIRIEYYSLLWWW